MFMLNNFITMGILMFVIDFISCLSHWDYIFPLVNFGFSHIFELVLVLIIIVDIILVKLLLFIFIYLFYWGLPYILFLF